MESALAANGKELIWDKNRGFLLSCPSNIGTGLRAGVHLKIPYLSKHNSFNGKKHDIYILN